MQTLVAHQKPGINRCGAFAKPSRYKSAARPASQTRAKKNEPWRRHAGITLANEHLLTRKERRRGLRRLMRWIARFAKRNEERANTRPQPLCALQILTLDSRVETISGWACATNGTLSLQSLCEKLGLSGAKLSQLSREIQNISASEFLDGLKLRRLRGILMEQFRAAARERWGSPGTLSERRCTEMRPEFSATPSATMSCEARERDVFEELPADELARRTRDLLDAVSERACGESPLYLRLNFESAAKLNRACVNVFGRTLRQIETLLAGEVAEFYLCAEELVLREQACGDSERGITARARWLYGRSDDAPEEPFLDRWSSAKTFRTQWLLAMCKEFG